MAGRVLQFSVPFVGEGFEKEGDLVYTFDRDNIIFKQVCQLPFSKLVYTKTTTIITREALLEGYEKLKSKNSVYFYDHNSEILMSINVKILFNEEGKRVMAAELRLHHIGRSAISNITITVDKMEVMFNDIIRNQRIMDNELEKENTDDDEGAKK